MKPRPVLIEWSDSTHISPGTWVDLDVAGEPGPCDVITVGWLIAKDRRSVTIASSITEADDMRGAFVIPTSCVKRMVRLSP